MNELGPVLKAAYPKVVATLTRVLGDMDAAMDATQDALVKALQRWQKDGVPAQPVAWLVTVGRNRAIDVMRREARTSSWDNLDMGLSNVVPLAANQAPARVERVEVEEFNLSELDDDLLRLMFTCCHPNLTPVTQITLVLKVVLGFSVHEIARMLLTSPATIEKRITRAKQRLQAEDIEYAVPKGTELSPRLRAVLQAIYLLFNEGYSRIQDRDLVRNTALLEAVRLGRMVCRLFRHNPEPRSLLALMLLSTARLPARLDEQGAYVPLLEQDRHRWDQTMIREGIALIDAVYVSRHPPSAYQIQAAISAIHSKAPNADATDWRQIVALYEKLAEYDSSPVVPVNLAVARCYGGEVAPAAEQLRGLHTTPGLADYQPYYAACGFVFGRLGARAEAASAYARAVELAQSAAEKTYLLARLKEMQ